MIDAILIVTYLAVAGALAVVVWAAVRRWQLHAHNSSNTTDGIPARKISMAVAGGLVVCLLVTFLAASSTPLSVNGKSFDSVFWLKTADMLINTSLILLIVAVIIVVCSNVRSAKSRR